MTDQSRHAQRNYDTLTREYFRVRTRLLPVTVGPWSYNRKPDRTYPLQGWKLHVSATLFTGAEVLRRVQKLLASTDVVVKTPRNLDVLLQINSGLNYAQIGKFLTIYARDETEAMVLAKELHRLTRGLRGPEVPFDSPYRAHSLVSYRYGSFIAQSDRDRDDAIIDARGRSHRDVRAPNRAVPRWVADPFTPSRSARAHTDRGPIGHDYVAYRALSQRGKGGVYQVLDLRSSPARLRVLKEGRRDGEVYWDGTDGRDRIRREAIVLRELRAARVPVPRVYRSFSQSGNAYLLLEALHGRALLRRGTATVANPSWRRSARLVREITELLDAIHKMGWVWRDCKPDNLIWVKGKLRPLDFEGACRQSETRVPPWGAPQYTPHDIYNSFRRPQGIAEDSYALGVIAFQFGVGRLPPHARRRQAAMLGKSRCPLELSRFILDSLGVTGRPGQLPIRPGPVSGRFPHKSRSKEHTRVRKPL